MTEGSQHFSWEEEGEDTPIARLHFSFYVTYIRAHLFYFKTRNDYILKKIQKEKDSDRRYLYFTADAAGERAKR